MKSMIIDGKKINFDKERNILEVVRKAKIEIPTFCYHSELSVYGACRLCLVEVEGRGILSSCSVIPEDGLVVKTNTSQIREMRKVTIELLLASYNHNCPSCSKNSSCKLQDIAFKLGVDKIRFKKFDKQLPIDNSSESLVRDPNKCILCGDCVRACEEIQGIGALDFVSRGSNVSVQPAFMKSLSQVDCVYCGQCARVCPTGSIVPKSHIDKLWAELDNNKKIVVAQIAPAVRVAIGEMFSSESGSIESGKMVSAMKMLGFDKVFDTAFSADLTVIEETREFIKRKESQKNLPLFTSCCPGWVKFAEQYHPEILDNLSTCKSPQQMMASVVKDSLPGMLNCKREDIVMVSVMPCTAKKFEASRDEFKVNGIPDVDIVITTQELARMITQSGIKFNELTPEEFDMPFGFKTGAGIIFGNSGGVSEAVLRYAYELKKKEKLEYVEFSEVRDNKGIKTASINIDGEEIRIAVVQNLKNAKEIISEIKSGKANYDLVEIMACPGGCVGGAGQPVYFNNDTLDNRKNALYATDKMLQLHKSQDNPYINKIYKEWEKQKDSHKLVHDLLHTSYRKRKRIEIEQLTLLKQSENTVNVHICFGTSCFIKGSQSIMKKMLNYISENDLTDIVNVKAGFCMENCDKGPTVTIGSEVIGKCTFERAVDVMNKQISELVISNSELAH
ncbi:MAG: [FeFe] hydrogenase, group A [Candidatus Kapabacteria bacterium]|nr:[FeFe] hydrogenase, group A [Ignavibacteriota bacterium]MCW5884447.1 [FeFe] hydrogenase, group A [Candidatus Kapabacteria bacterium]